MNKPLEQLAESVVSHGYATTNAHVYTDPYRLVVTDLREMGVKFVVWVEDYESFSYKIEEQTTSGVTMATASVSNMPLRVVAAMILEGLNG